jgi:hypothetical protein
MCMKPQPGEKLIPIRCQPISYPCPTCGRRGHRKRRLERFVRSLAYGQVCWLRVCYAEYTARCRCRKSFRSCPANVCPKADYDNLVRQAVLNRILDDGLNARRTIAAMKRDFLLDLSTGFVYDCLDWGLDQLNQGRQRRLAQQRQSGTLCIDELHLGEYTLLLATDPLADCIIGYSLVKINSQAFMRRFLLTLQYWGFEPKMVVTDGSNLYPATLAEVWPQARHQLCVFHVLQDVTNKVLAAVRRLRRQQAKRGRGGRKRRGGRLSQAQRRQRQRRGPTNKEKAAFVFKHRFLIVKRTEHLSRAEWDKLVQMFAYLPELRPLWHFCREVYQLFNAEQVVRLARRRHTLLLKSAEYQEVPELVQAMGLLRQDKFDKMIAFLESPVGARVRTNNHVERANRRLRFDEKVRYHWRRGGAIDRFVRLRLGRLALPTISQSPTQGTPDAKPSATPLRQLSADIAKPGGD